MNNKRAQLYKKDVGEEAYRAVKRLMFWEKIMKPFTYLVDLRSKKFRKKGLPLFCEDTVPMAATPSYRSHFSVQIPDQGKVPEIKTIKRELKNAYKRGSFQALYTYTVKYIHLFENNRPQSMCLTRHFLESIARSAKLADPLIKQANSADRLVLTKRIWGWIKLQLFGLGTMNSLDQIAQPLNNKGVAVYCNDVPVIPY